MAILDYFGQVMIYLPSEKREGIQEPPHIHVTLVSHRKEKNCKFWLDGGRLGWVDVGELERLLSKSKERKQLTYYLLINSPS
jgi:hypothetical protein